MLDPGGGGGGRVALAIILQYCLDAVLQVTVKLEGLVERFARHDSVFLVAWTSVGASILKMWGGGEGFTVLWPTLMILGLPSTHGELTLDDFGSSNGRFSFRK